MIKVLQSWAEIGGAINTLEAQGLPLHPTPQKNWDHFTLLQFTEGLRRDITIVDMGCGPGSTLCFLRKIGFINISGIDLKIWWSARLRQARTWIKEHHLKPPWKYRRGDIVSTGLAGDSVDLVLAVSVVEHGVDLIAFAKECARILRNSGVLFLTTDYWESIDNSKTREAIGLPWRPFNKITVKQLIQILAQEGLQLIGDTTIPNVRDAVVHYGGERYTFIQIAVRKTVSM